MECHAANIFHSAPVVFGDSDLIVLTKWISKTKSLLEVCKALLGDLDDYPDFCIPCAEAVAKDSTSVGIVLGGSGNGEQISANKVKGIRAALVWSLETAKLAREHNNANVISVGQRQHTAQEVKDFIDLFLATKFPGDERHSRRIQKVSNYEVTGDL